MDISIIAQTLFWLIFYYSIIFSHYTEGTDDDFDPNVDVNGAIEGIAEIHTRLVKPWTRLIKRSESLITFQVALDHFNVYRDKVRNVELDPGTQRKLQDLNDLSRIKVINNVENCTVSWLRYRGLLMARHNTNDLLSKFIDVSSRDQLTNCSKFINDQIDLIIFQKISNERLNSMHRILNSCDKNKLTLYSDVTQADLIVGIFKELTRSNIEMAETDNLNDHLNKVDEVFQDVFVGLCQEISEHFKPFYMFYYELIKLQEERSNWNHIDESAKDIMMMSLVCSKISNTTGRDWYLVNRNNVEVLIQHLESGDIVEGEKVIDVIEILRQIGVAKRQLLGEPNDEILQDFEDLASLSMIDQAKCNADTFKQYVKYLTKFERSNVIMISLESSGKEQFKECLRIIKPNIDGAFQFIDQNAMLALSSVRYALKQRARVGDDLSLVKTFVRKRIHKDQLEPAIQRSLWLYLISLVYQNRTQTVGEIVNENLDLDIESILKVTCKTLLESERAKQDFELLKSMLELDFSLDNLDRNFINSIIEFNICVSFLSL